MSRNRFVSLAGLTAIALAIGLTGACSQPSSQPVYELPDNISSMDPLPEQSARVLAYIDNPRSNVPAPDGSPIRMVDREFDNETDALLLKTNEVDEDTYRVVTFITSRAAQLTQQYPTGAPTPVDDVVKNLAVTIVDGFASNTDSAGAYQRYQRIDEYVVDGIELVHFNDSNTQFTLPPAGSSMSPRSPLFYKYQSKAKQKPVKTSALRPTTSPKATSNSRPPAPSTTTRSTTTQRTTARTSR